MVSKMLNYHLSLQRPGDVHESKPDAGVHSDRSDGSGRDPRSSGGPYRAAGDEPTGRGACSSRATGRRIIAAGSEAVPAGQPALSDQRAGARRAGGAPAASAGSAELETRRVPGAAAARSVGQSVPLP